MFNSVSSPFAGANSTPLSATHDNRTGRTSTMGSLLKPPVQEVKAPLPKPLTPQEPLTSDVFVRKVNINGIPVTYQSEKGLEGVHVFGSQIAKKMVKAELRNTPNELHTVGVLGQLEQSIRHIPHGESQKGYAQSLRDTVKHLPTVSPKLKSVFSKSVKGLIS